jgi:dihydroflavonol-4-reductase
VVGIDNQPIDIKYRRSSSSVDKKILVTGAEGFLGYHTIKLLNERQIKPKGLVEVENEQLVEFGLKNLQLEIIKGSIQDLQVLRQACEGIDTVFHMKFEIALGGGEAAEEKMNEINVVGTRNVLQAAKEAGVKRVVVSSSCLAVGLNYQPEPLNETADWNKYQFNLPYALSRRQAEQESLVGVLKDTAPHIVSRFPYPKVYPLGRNADRPVISPTEVKDNHPEIIAIAPSFTMGPEDYLGAPANQLANLISQGKFKFGIPVGFGILDVRDYAAGALLAAEKGRHGQRYLLSGENVTLRQFIDRVANIAGVEPPKWLIPLPAWLVYPIVAVIQLFNKIRGRSSTVNLSILKLWKRYAFYDTSLAEEELGWKARSLDETIADSLQWIAQK